MERLSSSKEIAEIKLLILYILDKAAYPVGGIQLTEYILTQRLFGFVLFQQHINELIGSGCVDATRADSAAFYSISAAGRDVLENMLSLLPSIEKNRVDRTVSALKRRVLNERAVSAEYTPDDEYKGAVTLTMREGGFTAIKLEVATASKDDARLICRRWKENTAAIYTKIVEALTGITNGTGEVYGCNKIDTAANVNGADGADDKNHADGGQG